MSYYWSRQSISCPKVAKEVVDYVECDEQVIAISVEVGALTISTRLSIQQTFGMFKDAYEKDVSSNCQDRRSKSQRYFKWNDIKDVNKRYAAAMEV